MITDYEKYRIIKLPPSAYYIPNFISEEEESDIKKYIYSVPKPKWTCLSNRRLQDYGGVPHKKGMIVEKMPEWLNKYVRKIIHLNVYPDCNAPNHVLVNEYLPGQGIMPHTDGPLFHPIVTTINCGSHTVLELRPANRQQPPLQLLLEPTSLLILKDDLYSEYLHCIHQVTSDTVSDAFVNLDMCARRYEAGETLVRKTRISVTIRNVPKVLKLKLF